MTPRTSRCAARWAGSGARRVSGVTAERRDALVRELEELRALLTAIRARSGEEGVELVAKVVDRRVRDVAGRLHEALWVARQARARAGSADRRVADTSIHRAEGGQRSRAPMSAVAA